MNDIRLTELCNFAFDLFPFINHNDDGLRKVRDNIYNDAYGFEQSAIERLSKRLTYYATNKPTPHEKAPQLRYEHLDNIRCANAFAKVALRSLDDKQIKQLLAHRKIDKKMSRDYKKLHAVSLSHLLKKA